MLGFFDYVKDGVAFVHKVERNFEEIKTVGDPIEVNEDNFDIVLQHGCMYLFEADKNTINEDVQEHLAEEYNKVHREYVDAHNEEIEKYNEEHKNDPDFEEREELSFTPKTSEEMVYEMDNAFISITEDEALTYIPFKYIFHNDNRPKHEKLRQMLFDYVTEEGFELEEAVEMVLL